MTLLDALFLAVVQGITEFLPISSSGHLVLVKTLLGLKSPGAAWEVALHLGTLGAVVAVFHRDILQTIKGLVIGCVRAMGPEGWRKTWNARPDFRVGCCILLASIPALLVGILLRAVIEQLFASTCFVLIMLFINGELLWLTGKQRLYRPNGKLRLSDAIVIGIAQAIALLPGLSRSGSTISFGLFRGVEPARAASFSFLLAVPAIIGAALLEIPRIADIPAAQIPHLLLAVAVSTIVGYAFLKLLLGVVRAGRLHRFAWYCWLLALVGLAYVWTIRACPVG